MKNKSYIKKESAEIARKNLFYSYDERYFNLWLNSYKISGLSNDQREYVMRRFWQDGMVSAFAIIKPTQKFLGSDAESFSDGLIGFAPFAPQNYNMYNYPTNVLLINERGVPYIPSKVMVSHVDCVLGYAQHSRQPIRTIVKTYIDRIVDVEMTIRTNLIAHKIPTLYEVTPESTQRAEDLETQILNDDPSIFINVGDADAIKAADSGIPFIIDKLYAYKKCIENELLTFLGIDNIGQEKNQAIVVDEANANNELINDFGDCIKSCLEEFSKDIKDTLGFTVTFTPTSTPAAAMRENSELTGPAGEASQKEGMTYKMEEK